MKGPRIIGDWTPPNGAMDLLSGSDSARLERFAKEARVDAASVGAALIEHGLRMLVAEGRTSSGATAVDVARSARQAQRRGGRGK